MRCERCGTIAVVRRPLERVRACCACSHVQGFSAGPPTPAQVKESRQSSPHQAAYKERQRIQRRLLFGK